MRLKSFVFISVFVLIRGLTFGQDWSEERHQIYSDSIDVLEDNNASSAEIAELMKVGLANGAEKFPQIHLEYLFSIIHQSFSLSQRDSMDKYLVIAEEVVKEHDPEQMWRYYLGKGNYYYDIPDHESSALWYTQSAKELRRIGNFERLTGVLSNLASTYIQNRNRDTARVILKEAIQIADSLNQIRIGMNARVNLANTYSTEDDYDNAAIYYSEAYDLSKRKNIRRSHAFNATNMGRLYQSLGQFEKAGEYFSEALLAAKEINLRRVIGAIYMQKADCELLTGNTKAAESTLEDMAQDSLQMSELWNRFLQSLEGRIQLSNGLTDQAYTTFRKIIAEYENLQAFPYRPDVFLAYAKSLVIKGEQDRALEAVQDGLEKNTRRFAVAIELLELKTELLENRMAYKAALKANKSRNVFADSLVTLNKIGIRLTEQARASLAEKESEMVDMSEDISAAEAIGERQAKIIAGLIAGIVGLGLIAFFYSRHQKLRIEKDLADVKQSLLRIQINPHFIFNILNSIQSSFLQEDQEKTIHLFNKFSNLMRRVLENSTNSFIPLNEELELLINYMELEKARTKNKFDYEVNIDDDVDIYLEEVPTMVLQIFLENSVWHGVVPKENRGKIQLSIAKVDEVLKITIEDDGVGRSFSLKNKSKDQRNKKSMGTDLVMQRVHLLNRKYGKGLRLSINDGVNNIGTRVELAV